MHFTTSLSRHRQVYHEWAVAGREPQWLERNGLYIVCSVKTKNFLINKTK